MSNVINFVEKKWEKEFNKDMQNAMNEVVDVLCTHLSPEIGVIVGKALAVTLKDVSDNIINKLEESEKSGKLPPCS